MWIVQLALRRPYTFVVMSILIVVLGVVTVRRMAVDIFPEINIPVVAVVWQYGGISAEEMERRIVTVAERAYTTTVNDIEHIESQSYRGTSLIKIYFQPNAKVEAAVAQLSAVSSTLLRIMPSGTTPPFVIRYSAANVPVLQVSLKSDSLAESELNDYANSFIRTQLSTVQGASVATPYGGKPRQVMVDLDLNALRARGLSPSDVSTAINAQNLILPAGSVKLGGREYDVKLNSSPETIAALNDIPIKESGGAMIYIRDVASVHDGFAPQTNIVRQDGKRGTFLTVNKNGGASTVDVVERIRAAIPQIASTLPSALELSLLFDQSVYVKESIQGVLIEGTIAAILTGAMILLFLGSWRSTVIVATSIPLSIVVSIIVMSLFGQTLNIMTLGGLALAVGILVDDATVEIENVHRNLGMKKGLVQAILDGAQQIATPAFVATLSICIVFVPVFFLGGVAGSLFAPLAMAVIFAMLASYFLSRTLVPTMMQAMLGKELHLYQSEHHASVQDDKPDGLHGDAAKEGDVFWRIHQKFNVQFEKFRDAYRSALEGALHHRKAVTLVFAGFVLFSLCLLPFIGRDFFPQIDAGQFRLNVRTPSGTRIEETERIFAEVEKVIREVVPKDELKLILDNIGLPYFGGNLVFNSSATLGSSDGEILVALEEHHQPTETYTREIRKRIKAKFPDLDLFYQPADIVTQILNFGAPSPIDIQVVGRDRAGNYKIAKEIERRVAAIEGAADVHLNQVFDAPQLLFSVDRTRAEEAGLTQREVASDILISLSGSGQTAPNFWINPKNGVSYNIGVQTRQYNLSTMGDLQSTPITGDGNRQPQLLANLATVSRSVTPAIVTHYNVQPTINIFAAAERRDLGGVAADIQKIIDDVKPRLPRGSTVVMRGQVESMNASFTGLGFGILFAIMLVYFLMVVNFQSWLDPFIIITALPGAICGIVWMLFVSQTTFNVPSLMGAIMCIGVATANSILLVTFANDQRRAGMNAFDAALSAGYTRLRPVLMTALAMMIGMLPMSLGLGEGGEQNAPLGRAVIGGLLVATATTLIFVPVVYSVLRKKDLKPQEETA
ncbi:MAG: efflux RND transporter permease subunit [Rhizobacter sp.]|nr:efflux RND transporter permease subunit [Chlorobiales bacterium]